MPILQGQGNTVKHIQFPLSLEIYTAPQRNPGLSRSAPVLYYTFLLSGNTLARQYRPVFKGMPSEEFYLCNPESNRPVHMSSWQCLLIIII